MDVKVDATKEEIQAYFREVVLNSALGPAIEKSIMEVFSSSPGWVGSAIEEMVKEAMREVTKKIVEDNFTETLTKGVKRYFTPERIDQMCERAAAVIAQRMVSEMDKIVRMDY